MNAIQDAKARIQAAKDRFNEPKRRVEEMKGLLVSMSEIEEIEETEPINKIYLKEKSGYIGQGINAYFYTLINNKEIRSANSEKFVWYDEKWNKQEVVLTQSILKKLFPLGIEVHLLNLEKQVNLNGKDFGIISNNILAHYLGQASVETGGFAKDVVIENGYYNTLERIGKVFSIKSNIYAKVEQNPTYYLKNSEHFLNMAYANKGGNGDEASGEGYKYRGRGYFQLTLKDNYIAFDKFFKENYYDAKIIDNPDLVATDKSICIISSLWYFKVYTIKTILKYTGEDDKYFKTITKTINSNAVDLEKRKLKYDEARNLLG
jgi:putative chitinase